MENTAARTTTTNAESTVLVFRDEAGSYFLLPLETLEQGRVPVDHAAEVERLVAAGSHEGDDVQGYFLAGCGGLKPPTEELPWYVEFILKHQESLGLR